MTMGDLPTDLPVRHFRNAAAWEKWLASNAGTAGMWLKIAKKDSGIASVTYAEALDVALCHGWIDGLKKSLDAEYFLQRFTPRKPRSLWSKINVGKVEQLIASGRMQAAGLREVDAAKADGRWEAAYHGASSMEVPAELAEALAKNRKAKAFFETLDKTNRYSFCWRVHTAVKPETKRARAEKFVAMLARGEKIHG
ncbi:MAG: YdeI/OmpD-associated family protein [Luteimonas sp.]|nr:YdeI/OmpD-associated family protein [Luteimonas sp.]